MYWIDESYQNVDKQTAVEQNVKNKENQRCQDDSNMLWEEWLSIDSQQRTEEISVKVIWILLCVESTLSWNVCIEEAQWMSTAKFY